MPNGFEPWTFPTRLLKDRRSSPFCGRISFLNNGHHAQLLAANALGPDLARRIEAYRVVAQTSAAK